MASLRCVRRISERSAICRRSVVPAAKEESRSNRRLAAPSDSRNQYDVDCWRLLARYVYLTHYNNVDVVLDFSLFLEKIFSFQKYRKFEIDPEAPKIR